MGRPWTPRTYKRNDDKLYKITTQWMLADDMCHSAHFIWASALPEALKKLNLVHQLPQKVIDFRVVDKFNKNAEDMLKEFVSCK